MLDEKGVDSVANIYQQRQLLMDIVSSGNVHLLMSQQGMTSFTCQNETHNCTNKKIGDTVSGYTICGLGSDCNLVSEELYIQGIGTYVNREEVSMYGSLLLENHDGYVRFWFPDREECMMLHIEYEDQQWKFTAPVIPFSEKFGSYHCEYNGPSE